MLRSGPRWAGLNFLGIATARQKKQAAPDGRAILGNSLWRRRD